MVFLCPLLRTEYPKYPVTFKFLALSGFLPSRYLYLFQQIERSRLLLIFMFFIYFDLLFSLCEFCASFVVFLGFFSFITKTQFSLCFQVFCFGIFFLCEGKETRDTERRVLMCFYDCRCDFHILLLCLSLSKIVWKKHSDFSEYKLDFFYYYYISRASFCITFTTSLSLSISFRLILIHLSFFIFFLSL